MNRYRLASLLVVLFTAASRANVIVDHLPHPYGGPDSDTLFTLFNGQPYSQRLADDFVLTNADQAVSLSWYGFYNADNPPAQETMRIRFYDARPSDGLPGLVLYEETFQNPSRIGTGRIILTGYGQHEYRYQASFAQPLSLDASTKYWIEVAQIGDINTEFRWESSVSARTGHAFINPGVVDWRSTLPSDDDLAFHLISPEPASLATLSLGLFVMARRRTGGRRPHGST